MNRKGLIASCLLMLGAAGMTGCAGRVYTRTTYYDPDPVVEPEPAPAPVVVHRTVHVDVDLHRRHDNGHHGGNGVARGQSQADIDRKRARRDMIRDQKDTRREMVREHRDERRAEKNGTAEASAR